ncbi:class I SAM-dependent methyltransferase [Pseudoxanthomonas japonensis]|nr:class I SAM-dependent methyltransferase [Pseudoxanthomonas japonensis]
MKQEEGRRERVANLGSGGDYLAGAINVDLYAEKADIRHDLASIPYPFDDNSFDRIRALNIIEHLDNPIDVMREIHRIGADGCLVDIRVPHFRSASLYEDITHVRGFAWRTFDVFLGDGTVYGEYADFRFEMVSRAYTPYLFPWLYRLLSRFPVLTDNLLSKYIPMASIEFRLRVSKGSKYSG